MRITQVESLVLRLPLTRPITSPSDGDRGGRLDHLFLLITHVDTDAGHRGLGFAYVMGGGGRAVKVIADDDMAPLLVGEDPLDHERLGKKVYWRLQTIGRRGLVSQVWSALDLALWDIKGKAAGLPLYKLLGGARESARVYGSDTGWLWMSPEEIVAASRPYIEQGMLGIKIKVGHPDPQLDIDRIEAVREAFGEHVWLAIDANQRYDYPTALALGRVIDEELPVDWFEEPLSCENVGGHVQLAQRLDVPICVGETLFGLDEVTAYLQGGAVDVLQVDLTRIGGLTPALKLAALAEAHHCPVTPHLLPEAAVHLACGLPNVDMVEWMPWLTPAFVEPPAIVKGQIVPPQRPGLGLEVRPDAVEKYRLPD